MSDLFELLGVEYHWPNKDDRFLTGQGRWPTRTSIDGWDQSFDCFVWTFTNAAETLVKSVTSNHQPAARIIWPTLFLYRHAIELSLKKCIADITEYLDGEPNVPSHHKLRELKMQLLMLFGRLDLPTDDDSTIGFSNLLDEISQFDPDGTVFRYPIDKRGLRQSLPTKEIDVVDLQKGAMKVLNFLHCVSEEIGQRSTSYC
ncbi:MAG TPA: hypothetical protein VIJ62_03685 [Rhizomicrobium sp.]